MSCKKDKTITFDEKVKGWTSFHSFLPEYMIGMNSRFFSFNNGELYVHHSDNVPRNTYYGVQYPTKVAIMFNENASDVKELQAVSLEGNNTWEALIKAYISNTDDFMESSISRVEFVKKEGMWYAYARRNEDINQLDSKSIYGIGRVTGVAGSTITIAGGSVLLTAGDVILNESLEPMGIIQDYASGVITMDTTGTLTSGDFIMGRKNPRITGGNLRGYTMRMDLEVMEDTKVELFAVNIEVMKSFT